MRKLIDLNRLRPVDSAGDNVLFLREPTDTIEIFRVGVPEPPGGPRVAYDGQLEFLGAAFPESTAVAGGLLSTETYWRRIADIDRHYVIHFSATRDLGDGGFILARHLGYLLYPPIAWPQATTVRETYRLVIPAGTAAGDYTLRMRIVWWADRPRAAKASQPDDLMLARRGYWLDLGSFTVSSNAGR